MKVKGKLPEVKPTLHHPDEVSPGHLSLDPERVQLAIEGYDDSEFAAGDLLELTLTAQKLIAKYAGELSEMAAAYDMPAKQAAMRIEEGFHLLDQDKLNPPLKTLSKLLDDLLDMLDFTDEENKKAMAAWAEDLKRNETALIDLLRLNIARDKKQIAGFVDTTPLSKEALWFVMHHLGAAVLPAYARVLAPLVDDERWHRGTCPICGNYPAMAGLVGDGGKRHLFCDTCGMVWTFARLQCPFCDNKELDSLQVMNTDDESPYHLDVCQKCQHYVKAVDYRKVPEKQVALLPVEDAATIYLDILAGKEKLRRE